MPKRDGNAFISAPMRDILMAHLDGAVVRIPDPERFSGRRAHIAETQGRSTECLINRGFLRKASKPRHTVITEAGRMALIKVLAEYAEVLIRAARHVEELKFLSSRPLVDESREVAETKDLQEAV